jgi:quercetin dioxygenase-like cupin family protein
MENGEFFKNYSSFISFREGRYGKATLFNNEHILVGLNCLKPGQEMEKHAHEVQCRFYLVLEGCGRVWVGEEQIEAQTGMVIWVPAGYTHHILNTGNEPMILLVGFAPSKAD